MKLSRMIAATAVAAVAATSPAQAQTISWTDWISSAPGSASGTMTFGTTTVNVGFTGDYTEVVTACGTNYWTNPTTYQGEGVPNAPAGCDIVRLSKGGLKTITFSSPVVDPLVAFVSWNGQPTSGIVFSSMLELVNEGPGYWGDGNITVSGNTMYPTGEAHGTVRMKGTYSSISFTDADEHWHGITVGSVALAPPPPVNAVPEPATVVLMGTGLAGLAVAARRRRR